MHNLPILLIHGGAWAMPDNEIAAHERGIANALDAGYAILEGAAHRQLHHVALAVIEPDGFHPGEPVQRPG